MAKGGDTLPDYASLQVLDNQDRETARDRLIYARYRIHGRAGIYQLPAGKRREDGGFRPNGERLGGL